MNGLRFHGFGHYAPDNRIDNNKISEGLDTNDEWIRTRTGIKNRHFVSEGQLNYEVAKNACERAIKDAGIDKDDISYLIVCSFCAEFPVPSLACMVQEELGIKDTCTCFDINAACSGFLYGLIVMRGLLLEEALDSDYGNKKYGIVIGSEVISKHLDMTDRGSCILFGDGAGALVVSLDKDAIYAHTSGSKGSYEVLRVGGKNYNNSFVYMNGSEVFKFAVSTIPKCIDEVLKKASLTMEDIDLVVCHQANKRIIDAVRLKYKESEEKFPMNINEYGNTSAASVPILLSELNEKGILKKGMKVILTGFGAGLTWAANLVEI